MRIIPLDNDIQKFKEHLENNPRVVFSASFGNGKTTFLELFKEEQGRDYFFVTLRPVNYSVSKNEDVFEYIKRDILLQLANADKLNGLDLNAAIDSIFSWETLYEALEFLGQFMPHGEILMKIFDKAKFCKDKYDEEKKTWQAYESAFNSQRGGLYEDDGYTQLIKSALQYVNTHEEKKTCLIIEDLDRIDPGHLFRILNVLGAHVDEDKQGNKFGFDHIIAVMDYEITEHIFHHFYGQQANYNGYMSKFYSHYPYYYSIKQVAVNHLRKVIENHTSISGDKIFDIEITQKSGATRKMKDIVSGLSVRDIASILDGYESQINRDAVLIYEGRVKTEAPILYLLAMLKLMNCPVSMNVVKNSSTFRELALKLLGNFLCCNTPVNIGAPFRHGVEYYQVHINNDGMATATIAARPYRENAGTNTAVETALQNATKCIRDWNY